jgi:hypothetical protein
MPMPVFALTIFTDAFLLFQVQPLIAEFLCLCYEPKSCWS